MTDSSFARWVGWSAAAHLALGIAIWIASPRMNPPGLVGADAAVTIVSLVDAPVSDDRRTPLPPQRPGPPVSPPTDPIERSTPAPTTGHSFADHPPAAWLPAPESASPDAPAAQPDIPGAPIAELPSSPPDPAPSKWVGHEPGARIAEVPSNSGPPVDQYRPLVLGILERAKRYPLVAQRRGIEGTVEVAFVIGPDGRLSNPELIASSNHRVLDEATLNMVRRVGSLPPPPDRETLRFPARIEYRLDIVSSSAPRKGEHP